ncbi:MAG: ACT domain-containing protein, partial [Natronospirillum sp.]
VSAYYLRITAEDKVGVLADITEILGELKINIEAIIQKEPRLNKDDDSVVPVIILSHEVREATMNQAIAAIEALDAVVNKVARIRVANLDK